jgi:hypothetical protein
MSGHVAKELSVQGIAAAARDIHHLLVAMVFVLAIISERLRPTFVRLCVEKSMNRKMAIRTPGGAILGVPFC